MIVSDWHATKPESVGLRNGRGGRHAEDGGNVVALPNHATPAEV